MKVRFIDFFAGIGGFRRGMEQAGHKCVGFCEFDKFAVASYTSMHLHTDQQREKLKEIPSKKRQKEILKDEYRNGEWYANDIRTVVAASLPAADCWCFGFPCQDISVAGKQAGFNGHRSSLFFAVTGLIRDTEEENRPKYLFIENVENLLSINGGAISSNFSLSWTRSGTMRNGRLSTVKISEYRKTGSGCSLSDILEESVPEKYFLSREQVEKIAFQ